MSDDLYPTEMLALAGAGRGGERLDVADASITLDNPLCGDRVTLDLRCDADGRVAELAHAVRGCVLCRAATAVLATHAVGLDATALTSVRTELQNHLRNGQALPDTGWIELTVFAPVGPYRSRHECVLLPFDAAVQALAAGANGASGTDDN